jgi:DNA-binding HxlR family transcriptional regulator
VSSKPAGLPLGPRSRCPIANALDVVGDRWTLLVVRDLFFLHRFRFSELVRSAEGIPTNILADRLRRLVEAGIVEKKAYQDRPRRYEYRMTPRGLDLLPLLREMVVWANRHIPGTGRPPKDFFEKAEKAGSGPPPLPS